MIYVIDACAAIAYLRGEPGAGAVEAALSSVDTQCFMHALNMMEVFYDFLRCGTGTAADGSVSDLRGAGIRVRSDLDEPFWKDAGAIKVAHHVSVADAVCLALARRLTGLVMTSDHHEFDSVVGAGVCDFEFIR